MHSKKYYIIYGLFFSLFVAAVLCLCLTIVQGMPHIDPVFFLMSFLVAFITSFVVTGEMMATNLFDRFVALCLQFWPVIVIVAFLCDPAAGGLAAVITGERAKKAKDVASAAGAEAPSANA